MLISEDSRLAALSGTMTKCEYRVVQADSYDLERKLNELGLEGWEVVTGVAAKPSDRYPDFLHFILRRPL